MSDRLCKGCGATKPLTEFNRKLKGYQTKCRVCTRAECKARYQAKHAEIRAEAKARYEANADELRAKQRDYYRANVEARKAYSAEWRKVNPDYAARKYQENAEKQRAAAREWKKANPFLQRSAEKARRSAKRRIPAWADRKLMADLYRYARIMRDAGVNCHVDHIVPLKGKTVRGIHCDANLTVLLAEDNLKKGAKLL